MPAEDVKRLLAERPDAIGLAVPGMPMGSPGMETGDHKESYDVLILKRDGSTDIFARHELLWNFLQFGPLRWFT